MKSKVPLLFHSQKMEKEWNQLTERILQLTLEMIFLLTGEVYVPETKTRDHVISSSCVTGGWSQSPITAPPPHSLTPEINKKVLEVTNKITELLTREEWEYLEEHQELYKEAIKKEEPPLISSDGSKKRNPPERCPHPPYSQDSAQEEPNNPPDYCDDVIVIKVEDIYDDRIYGGDEQYKEEGIPAVSEDGRSTKNVLNKYPPDIHHNDDAASNSPLENSSTMNLHSGPPLFHPRISPTRPQPVTHHTVHSDSELAPYSQYNRNITHAEKSNLNSRTPIGSKKFECTECGKCFTQTSHLVTHQRIHTGEKPHSCSICGKFFNDKSYLVTHQKIHTGEKPYTCSHCGKAFAKRSNLVRHERIHTGEKPYSCSDCGKCFAWKPSLLYHQIKHGGDRPDSNSDAGSVLHPNHYQ